MNKLIAFVATALAFASCTHSSDPLFGTWNATKVHVDFDETRTTPDMVKQIGEIEKQNQFEIKSDSTMVFTGNGSTLEGQISLQPSGMLYCNGEPFGIWSGDRITTQSPSPFGEIKVEYSKK